MKTRKVIEDRLKRMATNKMVYYDIPDYVHFNHKFPYKRLHSKNGLYHYLCMFLQRGTNMLALSDKGEPIPATRDVIRIMSGMVIETFDRYLTMLILDGIVMQVKCGGLERFYINPYFAIAGDHLPQFLIDMFNVSGEKIIGEHMFAKDNQLYNDNRNKDQRFGYLRDREPYQKHGKYKKRKKK